MLSLGVNALVEAIDSSCSSSDDSSESESESSKFMVVSGTLAFTVEEPLKDKYGESFFKNLFKVFLWNGTHAKLNFKLLETPVGSEHGCACNETNCCNL